MKLSYEAAEPGPKKWYASTDNGDYDGAGETPFDALVDLVQQLEREVF